MESVGGSKKLTVKAGEVHLPPSPSPSHKELLFYMGTESFGKALGCHSAWPYFLEDIIRQWSQTYKCQLESQ